MHPRGEGSESYTGGFLTDCYSCYILNIMPGPTYIDLNPGTTRPIPKPRVTERHKLAEFDDGQRLDVSVYNEENQQDTIVQFLAWSGYANREDEVQRGKVMAGALDATLITVDNPGMGPNNSRLNHVQGSGLRRGEIETLSTMQMAALEQAEVNLADVSLFGYSMGAVMASAAVTHLPRETHVKKLALLEPVAVETSSVPALSRDFVLDGLRDGEYKAENPDWYRRYKGAFPVRQMGALYRYVQFMADNEGYAILDHNQDRLDGTDITVVSAEDSRVTSLDSTRALADRLLAEHWVMKGENHSMLNSLGRISLLLEMLRRCDRL